MRSMLALGSLIVVLMVMTGCWEPWSKSHKESRAEVSSDQEVTYKTTEVVKEPQQMKVLLLNEQDKVLWAVNTSKDHVEFIEDTGHVKIDGQLWEGPYRVIRK